MKPTDSIYLTPHETEELLKVARSTVLRWVERGYLHPHVTPGGHRRYLKAEIEEVMRGGRILPDAPPATTETTTEAPPASPMPAQRPEQQPAIDELFGAHEPTAEPELFDGFWDEAKAAADDRPAQEPVRHRRARGRWLGLA